MSQRLGDLLIKEKIITPEQLEQALKKQKEVGNKKRLGSILVELNILADEDVTNFLSRQYGVPAINLQFFEMDASVVKLVPEETARKHQVLPLSRVGASLTIAMVDPTNVFAMDDIKFMTGFNIEPVVASETAIMAGIEQAYSKPAVAEENLDDLMASMGDETDIEMQEETSEASLAELERGAEEAPIVKLVNFILTDAVKKGASDIHIEPYEKEYRVRYRIDGVLQTVMQPPLKLKDAITSRIKIMSKLDISEKRLPQDGRIMLKMILNGRKKQLDYRVNSLPVLWGEKVVMRLLDKENLRLDMTKLGFEPESLEMFERNILKPFGMVLVTGPTGSGKTNTLYSAISKLNKPDTNIMTAEDPVEFQLAGVNQVQMKDSIGLNFAAALRAFLRQDPNTILVGEIRDFETAEIGIKAALTGHLVLSTLHTNGAPETISRLMNMGIEPFLVATAVNVIVAQRLIRRICSNCIEEDKLPVKTMLDYGFTPAEAESVIPKKGKGCEKCNGTGNKGRCGLYEVMELDDDIRDLILVGASAVEIKKKAIENGMITLRRSGLRKVMDGAASLEEVARETVLG